MFRWFNDIFNNKKIIEQLREDNALLRQRLSDTYCRLESVITTNESTYLELKKCKELNRSLQCDNCMLREQLENLKNLSDYKKFNISNINSFNIENINSLIG